MLNEPRPMREIHQIQEKIYEEHKNMSTLEELEAIRRSAEEAEKSAGEAAAGVKFGNVEFDSQG